MMIDDDTLKATAANQRCTVSAMQVVERENATWKLHLALYHSWTLLPTLWYKLARTNCSDAALL